METTLKNLNACSMIFRGKFVARSLPVLMLLVSFMSLETRGQATKVENSIFWQISGNGLTQSSYLFGTFHLIGASYIDSLAGVTEKFNTSKLVIGELVMDSTLLLKMMGASQLKGTTLDQLLDPASYKETASWLKELSGYDLTLFNSLNPMTIQILLMTMLQQKYYPLDQSRELPMDMYFQQRAKSDRKDLIGLESFEVQVNALFDQFSPQRQSEMLIDFVHEKAVAVASLRNMNKLYREGNLEKLEGLMTDKTYTDQELQVLIYERNESWAERIPSLIKEQQSFIAVGALHLSGTLGLVTRLRQKGYTVVPVALQ